jgi:6,7-dimethyl-8-ribityllumazine synthase
MFSIDSDLDARGLRIAVLASRFNVEISRRLVAGCRRQLADLRCEHVDEHWVPGAFEIPLAAQALAESRDYDAVVALGAVIRGGTPHFDYVCRAVTDGLREVNLRSGIPIAFGVLTTENLEQALERSAEPGELGSNKGGESAAVAVEMARFVRRMREAASSGAVARGGR